jgi:hypothetical protein
MWNHAQGSFGEGEWPWPRHVPLEAVEGGSPWRVPFTAIEAVLKQNLDAAQATIVRLQADAEKRSIMEPSNARLKELQRKLWRKTSECAVLRQEVQTARAAALTLGRELAAAVGGGDELQPCSECDNCHIMIAELRNELVSRQEEVREMQASQALLNAAVVEVCMMQRDAEQQIQHAKERARAAKQRSVDVGRGHRKEIQSLKRDLHQLHLRLESQEIELAQAKDAEASCLDKTEHHATQLKKMAIVMDKQNEDLLKARDLIQTLETCLHAMQDEKRQLEEEGKGEDTLEASTACQGAHDEDGAQERRMWTPPLRLGCDSESGSGMKDQEVYRLIGGLIQQPSITGRIDALPYLPLPERFGEEIHISRSDLHVVLRYVTDNKLIPLVDRRHRNAVSSKPASSGHQTAPESLNGMTTVIDTTKPILGSHRVDSNATLQMLNVMFEKGDHDHTIRFEHMKDEIIAEHCMTRMRLMAPLPWHEKRSAMLATLGMDFHSNMPKEPQDERAHSGAFRAAACAVANLRAAADMMPMEEGSTASLVTHSLWLVDAVTTGIVSMMGLVSGSFDRIARLITERLAAADAAAVDVAPTSTTAEDGMPANGADRLCASTVTSLTRDVRVHLHALAANVCGMVNAARLQARVLKALILLQLHATFVPFDVVNSHAMETVFKLLSDPAFHDTQFPPPDREIPRDSPSVAAGVSNSFGTSHQDACTNVAYACLFFSPFFRAIMRMELDHAFCFDRQRKQSSMKTAAAASTAARGCRKKRAKLSGKHGVHITEEVPSHKSVHCIREMHACLFAFAPVVLNRLHSMGLQPSELVATSTAIVNRVLAMASFLRLQLPKGVGLNAATLFMWNQLRPHMNDFLMQRLTKVPCHNGLLEANTMSLKFDTGLCTCKRLDANICPACASMNLADAAVVHPTFQVFRLLNASVPRALNCVEMQFRCSGAYFSQHMRSWCDRFISGWSSLSAEDTHRLMATIIRQCITAPPVVVKT